MLLICASCPLLRANEIEPGSSSRQYRQQAIQAIPFQQLNQATREKISEIVEKPSIYRRLPVTAIQADEEYFRFLIRYPEVIVNIWQLMGVTQMTTERTGPFTVDTNDGAGTISSLELVYGNETTHVFYGVGSYEGPVIRKQLTGRCVLVLQTIYTTDAQGRPQSTNQMDVFLKIDNAALGMVAKTIQPIVGTTADHNFTESLKFVQRLNETTINNGPGVQQMATRLQIDDAVRDKFIETAGAVFERSVKTAARPAMSTPDISRLQQPPTTSPSTFTPAHASPVYLSAPYYPNSPQVISPYVNGNPVAPYPQQNISPSYVSPKTSYHQPPTVFERFSDRHIASRPYGYQAPHYSNMR
jgi:hypothetical protein